MKINEIDYKGIKSVEIINNGIRTVITTEVGPRILFFGFENGENHLVNLEKDLQFKNVDKFVAYGGHRLWTSPEDPIRTYEADSKQADFEIIEGGVCVTSSICEIAKTRKSIEIVATDTGINIMHVVENCNQWDIEFSLWGLSQMAPNGLVVVPQNIVDTKLLANRNLVMWPYSSFSDERLYLGDKYITIKGDGNAKAPFKLGTLNFSEYAGYFNHGELFVKEFEYDELSNYPDYQCNFESYTCSEFTEIESVSPLTCVKRNECAVAFESWNLYKDIDRPSSNDEAAISNIFTELGYTQK